MSTVIITGANGNLGTAVVKKFLDTGYKVIGVDGSSGHLGFALGNPNFEMRAVNLGNETEAASFVSACIAKYGQIDAALMLVGGFAMGTIDGSDGAAVQKMYSLNFETAYYTTRPLLQHMKEKGSGRLVFMGARPALVADQGKDKIAYALAKSLLFRLAELINAENAGTNITASVVVPSTIDTEINRQSMPDANPGDWVKASQIAELLEFICSDKGSPVREAVYKIYNNA